MSHCLGHWYVIVTVSDSVVFPNHKIKHINIQNASEVSSVVL